MNEWKSYGICGWACFDVLVGINLLREGLDIPEVSLVAILDADKEGFLRTETSLIQTIGRAATKCGRQSYHVCGPHQQGDGCGHRKRPTEGAKFRTITIRHMESRRHRSRSRFVPLSRPRRLWSLRWKNHKGKTPLELTKKELNDYIKKLEKEMKQAAQDLQFERAAQLQRPDF